MVSQRSAPRGCYFILQGTIVVSKLSMPGSHLLILTCSSGRPFLHHMIDLSKGVRALYHRVRLNAGFRSDLKWWVCFLPLWNGHCPINCVVKQEPQTVVTSDASWSWFQLRFPEGWNDVHITMKELLPIVLAAALWSQGWRGKTECWKCDSAAVVDIINSGGIRWTG